jgi:hypothetical protein
MMPRTAITPLNQNALRLDWAGVSSPGFAIQLIICYLRDLAVSGIPWPGPTVFPGRIRTTRVVSASPVDEKFLEHLVETLGVETLAITVFPQGGNCILRHLAIFTEISIVHGPENSQCVNFFLQARCVTLLVCRGNDFPDVERPAETIEIFNACYTGYCVHLLFSSAEYWLPLDRSVMNTHAKSVQILKLAPKTEPY